MDRKTHRTCRGWGALRMYPLGIRGGQSTHPHTYSFFYPSSHARPPIYPFLVLPFHSPAKLSFLLLTHPPLLFSIHSFIVFSFFVHSPTHSLTHSFFFLSFHSPMYPSFHPTFHPLSHPMTCVSCSSACPSFRHPGPGACGREGGSRKTDVTGPGSQGSGRKPL